MKKTLAVILALSFLSISSLSFAKGECSFKHRHHKKHWVKSSSVSQYDVIYETYRHQNRYVRLDDVELYPEDYQARPVYLHTSRYARVGTPVPVYYHRTRMITPVVYETPVIYKTPVYFHTNRYITPVVYETPVYFHKTRMVTVTPQTERLNWVFYHQNRMTRVESFEPTVNQVEPNFEAFTDTYATPVLIEKTYFHKHRFFHKNRCR